MIFLFLLCASTLHAIEFEFKYTTGHTYNIISTVDQEIFFNGIKSHDALIINRVAVTEKEALPNGSAHIEASFSTRERAYWESTGEQSVWGEDYYSTFSRDKLGNYILDENAFMPVVRNVPVFPDYNVEPGDTWTAEGVEVHDLRESFGIPYPFRVPFEADYVYQGTQIKDGQTFHVISVRYNLLYEPPVEVDMSENTPTATVIYSDQILYWDIDKGFLDHYSEEYYIIMETSWGDRFEFVGTAYAEVTDFAPREVDQTLVMIQDKLDELNIDDAGVHVSPEGITITLDNIRFEADSAVLLQSELYKLEKIAQVIKSASVDGLLIKGHTARAGTEKEQIELSEQRASAVADYLIELDTVSKNNVVLQGLGASDPVAPNDTEANKAQNRRVEITIIKD